MLEPKSNKLRKKMRLSWILIKIINQSSEKMLIYLTKQLFSKILMN
jgi:hypothetical protein